MTEYEDENKEKILVFPIIEFIKKLGKPINKYLISYYSEKEKMDVFIG